MSVGARKSSFSPESRVQWLNTVGSVLWEGGARRCRPGFRPWSRGDGAGRPECLDSSNGMGRSRTPPVGVRACTLEGPGAHGSPGPHKGEVRGLARAC